jgi:hypothetical protein
VSGRADTALWFALRFVHKNQPLPLSLLYRLAPPGTSYAAAAMAMLDSALGTDFGLSSLHAFSETAQYRLHVEGPSGQCFNYADAVADQPLPPCFSWLASRFRHAHAAVHAATAMATMLANDARRPHSKVRDFDRFFALHAVWFKVPDGYAADAAQVRARRLFPRLSRSTSVYLPHPVNPVVGRDRCASRRHSPTRRARCRRLRPWTRPWTRTCAGAAWTWPSSAPRGATPRPPGSPSRCAIARTRHVTWIARVAVSFSSLLPRLTSSVPLPGHTACWPGLACRAGSTRCTTRTWTSAPSCSRWAACAGPSNSGRCVRANVRTYM